MAINERLVEAAMPIVESLRPREDYDRARRVERGLDNEGNPIIDPRPFLALRSPNGTVFRIRITNDGQLSVKQEM